MDPPLINESSFSTTIPSLDEIWSLSCSCSNNGGGGFMSEWVNEFVSSDNNDDDCVDNRDGSVEESTVTYPCPSFVCGGFKRKDCVSQSTSSANALKGSSCKLMKPSDVKDENGGLKGGGEDSSVGSKKRAEKPSEPPKDYIHVRARRGQATDNHSLAERARREKISERMKILQDLVPGCNKVIGKALVLDEIINYVQSLQQQVEFLSMKLEAVTSGMIPSINGVLSKDMSQLDVPPFDACGMMFDAQGLTDFTAITGPQSEWLHMQLGGHYAHT